MRYLLGITVIAAGLGSSAFAEVIDTAPEEAVCKQIGFKRQTVAFADCVMELVGRGGVQVQAKPKEESGLSAKPKKLGTALANASGPAIKVRSPVRKGPPSKSASGSSDIVVKRTPATPNEALCVSYGFSMDTGEFGQCLLQIDQAQRQAEIAQQQYEMQVAQYQQQQAAFEAQQDAIKKERDRRKWEMLARLGAGMANSRSPSFLGAFNEGLAAANGVQIDRPVAPPPPPSQNYTLRLPNGNQVYCSYNAGYMSCR